MRHVCLDRLSKVCCELELQVAQSRQPLHEVSQEALVEPRPVVAKDERLQRCPLLRKAGVQDLTQRAFGDVLNRHGRFCVRRPASLVADVNEAKVGGR